LAAQCWGVASTPQTAHLREQLGGEEKGKGIVEEGERHRSRRRKGKGMRKGGKRKGRGEHLTQNRFNLRRWTLEYYHCAIHKTHPPFYVFVSSYYNHYTELVTVPNCTSVMLNFESFISCCKSELARTLKQCDHVIIYLTVTAMIMNI